MAKEKNDDTHGRKSKAGGKRWKEAWMDGWMDGWTGAGNALL